MKFKVQIVGIAGIHDSNLDYATDGKSIEVFNDGFLSWARPTLIFSVDTDVNKRNVFRNRKVALLQAEGIELRGVVDNLYTQVKNSVQDIVSGGVSKLLSWEELRPITSIYAPPEKTEQPKKAYDVVLKSRTPGTGYYTYLEPANSKAFTPTNYIVYSRKNNIAEFASIWEIYVYGYDLDFRNKKAKILLDIRATIRKNKTGMFYWREVDGSVVNIENGVKVTEYDWDNLITVNTNDYEQINRTSPAKRAGEREETDFPGRARKALPECVHQPIESPSNGGRRASKLPAPILPY